MKKYLLISLLIISNIALSKSYSNDSVYYKHSFTIKPIPLIVMELRATYCYRIDPKNAIELNFAVPVSYMDKYSKQQIPLSFQWNDGWVEPFTLPTTIGVKYCMIKNNKNGYSQFGFGFNYKQIKNAIMSFGGGDAGGFDILYSQKRKEFISDYTYNIEKRFFSNLSIKFFVGGGLRLGYNNTTKEINSFGRLIIPREGYIYFANTHDAIHNENGFAILPSIYLGVNLSFNFCKRKK
ncbi:MAG: hypothetical protein RJA07_313 [Bacteroidota bacterium]|jgi:hypothetical protein